MRIMIKGGVWKNTEDEILKAAVMKYGKNQWARISSLLVRKSAKQCKARWYEWLDPSIKKTEWTREEDEKLLHLAKLMPTQWRTIAPIVGRTPAQCLERYEKLLDAACSKDEAYEAADDPRRLRPGEIDPNPESKPARPDPVDMDEDEKEMLSEARARLANTRGKKAKRKAREKQLEEARRLASLQKRRELKAAGLDLKQRKRKQKGIDYNAEIPFEKKPPPGFFETSKEQGASYQTPTFPLTVEQLEGKRRVDIEDALRKQDSARNKIVQRHDAPSAILQVNKLNDPEAVRKRSKLALPSPQISDRELEEIAKMGYSGDMLANGDEEEGSAATRALLASYGQTPARGGVTPLRTPQRTPGGKGDAIMMEAENLAMLRDTKTPLAGGENPELHPSDFSGVTPKKREIHTPNPIATPLHTPGSVGGVTPRGMTPAQQGSAFGLTPRGTPIRDELHINDGMETPGSIGARAEKQRQLDLKRNLRAGLGNLPAPRHEYQILVPEVPADEKEDDEAIEADMSDVLVQKRHVEAAQEAALLRKRSKVLQRGLPRPPLAHVESWIESEIATQGSAPMTPSEEAAVLIRDELALLLKHDLLKYPLEESKKDKKNSKAGLPNGPTPQLEDFEEDDIQEAALMIEEEVQMLRVAMGHEDATLDQYAEAHDSCADDLIYVPAKDSLVLASVASTGDRLSALQGQFEAARKQLEGETKKGVKLEQRIRLLTQGYQVRGDNLWQQVEASHKEADTLGTELECFRALHHLEQLAAPRRIENLRAEVEVQIERERSLQMRYENLLVEQDNLRKLIRDHDAALKQSNEDEARAAAVPVATALTDEQPATAVGALASSEGLPVDRSEPAEAVGTEASVAAEGASLMEDELVIGPPLPPPSEVVEEDKDMEEAGIGPPTPPMEVAIGT
eukprot:SM000355S13193  [mRNA]  locus=s355:12158:17386:- [translate_table: standard]